MFSVKPVIPPDSLGNFTSLPDLDFPEFYKGKNGWINIPKDASPGPETSAQFKHNERWMRRYLKTLGFSWAKNVYPENVRPPYSMHNAEWTTVAALEFIEENKDGPFYLHLCSTLLHGPDKSWRKSMDLPAHHRRGGNPKSSRGHDTSRRASQNNH